jgi:hypothetical protein
MSHRKTDLGIPCPSKSAKVVLASVFMAWRDKLAAKSRRQADYAWQVLARILSCMGKAAGQIRSVRDQHRLRPLPA